MDTIKSDVNAIRLICDELSKTGKMYILTGDFNLKHGWCYSLLEHMMKSYNIKQIVTEPTRGNALLDLIITNQPAMCINTNVTNPHLSDHCAVSTYINIQKQKKMKISFTFRDYKNINDNNLYTELNDCMANYTTTDSIHTSFDKFLNIITSITDKHAPIRNKTIFKHTKITKLSENTKNELFKRDQLYKLAKRDTSTACQLAYKKQKQLVKKLISEDSKSYIQTSMTEKGVWPVLTALTKAKTKINIPFSPDEINTHFTNICNRPTTRSSNAISFEVTNSDTFKVSEVSAAELAYVWRRMKNKQSTGTDSLGMSNYMFNLLMNSNIFRNVFLNILNMSITQCEVPYKLKIAKIIAIPKCEKPLTLNDVRPISILPVISKVLEKCVYLQLRRFISKHDILYTHQYGFRPKHSTEHAELYILDKAKTAIQRNNMYAVVALDVKKAFDTVNRNIFYGKLESYNICSSWFKAYLSDRQQYVQVDNCKSTISTTIRSVPQGGCLSSIAFAIYINDLYKAIKHSELVLFADDSQTCKEININNIQCDMSTLQNDCNYIVEWFTQNDLELNASKTELIVHSSKKNRDVALQQCISVNGHQIKCSESMKSLGLIKDQMLLWNLHTDHIVKKASKSLWKLRCLKPLLTKQQLKLAIETLLLTQIYYICVVWGEASKKYLKRINKIVKDAYRLLTNGSSTSDCEWLYIEEMYLYKSLILCFSANQKISPPSFFNIVNHSAIQKKETRSGNVRYVCKDSCKSYLVYNMTKMWAQCSENTSHSDNINVFKDSIKNEIIARRPKSEVSCDQNIIDEVLEYIRLLYTRTNPNQTT